MSWLTDFVRPRIRNLVRREVPENLWKKCPACEQMLFHRELQENLHVCKHCQHHLKFPLKERLANLFDSNEYTVLPLPPVPQDPLHFKDSKKYTERLKEARQKTHEEEAILLVHGTIGGYAVVVACFNFDFIGGSMGMAVGEALLKGSDTAIEHKIPFIVIPSSGGARMQEGILALMQMPRSIIAVARLREARIPYITVLTNPTTGGVSASFASIGDIALAEPGSIIGFTGARVIQETLRIPLPQGFQTSEYQVDHGMLDMVVHRHNLKKRLVFLCALLSDAKKLQARKTQRSLTLAG